VPESTARGDASGPALALAVCLLVGVAAGGVALEPLSTVDGRTTAAVSLTVSGDTLAFVHRGGPALRVAALRLVVTVDGTPLRHQPPIPFFAARGFRAGPTGPFNRGGDGRWTPGERASLTVASTNRPAVTPGATVTVRFVADGRTVATATARATTRGSAAGGSGPADGRRFGSPRLTRAHAPPW
jgi:hypothetical protein